MSMVDRLIAEAKSQSRPVVVLADSKSDASAVSVKVEPPTQARSTLAALAAAALCPRPDGAAKAVADRARRAGIERRQRRLAHRRHRPRRADARICRAAARRSPRAARLPSSRQQAGQRAARRRRRGLAATASSKPRSCAPAARARGAPCTPCPPAAQRLGEAPFTLQGGRDRARRARFDLPLELRNQVTRIEDRRRAFGRRRAPARCPLAMASRSACFRAKSREQAQPLLAPLYYIERALVPFSEIAKSEDANLAAVIDAVDQAQRLGADARRHRHAAARREGAGAGSGSKKGGVLVRFAGPRLEKGGDDLLPVPLRIGGRTLGGALSWSTPQPLAPFDDDRACFAGLPVPQEVTGQQPGAGRPGR